MDMPVRDRNEEEAPRMLVVDDDERFCSALRHSFEQRGYAITVAHSVPEALELIGHCDPEYAIIDLRLPGPSGLSLVSRLRQADPEMRIVVLTGYASIATAVEAIKLGATNYLAKPVDAETIERAFCNPAGDVNAAPNDCHMSIDRLEWEHIQNVLSEQHGNISATARALGMHRRTLQRKLAKRPVKR